jgi:hypothetical protein
MWLVLPGALAAIAREVVGRACDRFAAQRKIEISGEKT